MKTTQLLFFLSSLLFMNPSPSFGQEEKTPLLNFFTNKVIFKAKDQYRSICSLNQFDTAVFSVFYKSIGGRKLTKKFPHASKPTSFVNENEQAMADLSLIFEFEFLSELPLHKVLQKLNAMELFEYAEPHYIPQFCFTPNDSAFSSQYSLLTIQAEAAWGINNTTARGDTNIVIGIIDTGVDPNHPDLKDQIKHNYDDPVDGLDNDGDGYIDNFSGWNFGENNNDPSFSKSKHGVHVSGIAAASTNNGIGLAGVGFNCKFLPVNITDTSGVITTGYEGIVYAADHGCAIINCSWGGEGTGRLGQDVITYATINKNCLVVAAAGNDGSEIDFFPADYQYVLSVTSTNSSDSVSKFSNYGYKIDVCAPGEKILSTYTDSAGYKIQSGTSMASPCVAGAAAILKSFYPGYNALQIGEQLKTTCDAIDAINDSIYSDKIGTGRINLFRALTQNNSPSIVMTAHTETDTKENLFFTMDTIYLAGSFTNYLASVNNLQVSISSGSEYLQWIDSTTELGFIPTLGEANNNNDPFTFRMLPNTPSHYAVPLKITYVDSASSYVHSEFFTVVVNVGFANININDVAISIPDNGRIGYHDQDQKGGIGFTYKNSSSLFYEAGLMVGTNGSTVSDGVRAEDFIADNDFESMNTAWEVIPAVHAEFEVEANFKDSKAYLPLPVSINQTVYAWSTAGNRNYIILNYKILNTGISDLVNMYAGIFVDWDIDASTFDSNRISFDAPNKLAYAYYSGSNGIYAGIKLLSNSAPLVHYAIDHIPGGAGGIDIQEGGFDGNEKYQALSTNRHNAGIEGPGNDVIDVVSSGPFIVDPGADVEVAFAFIAGDNLLDLQQSAKNAQLKYDQIENILANVENPLIVYPNPTSAVSTIDYYVWEENQVTLTIINLLGAPIQTILSQNQQVGLHRVNYDLGYLENGCYFYQLEIGGNRYIKKIIVSN